MSIIGKRLQEERKRLGFSQEEFAGVAGVTRRPYAEWESGKTAPNATQLAAMFDRGADIQYVVTGNRSDMALTPDERELLALFRAASLVGKAAAIGALQGATGTSQPAAKVNAAKGANVVIGHGGQVAGRDINNGRK